MEINGPYPTENFTPEVSESNLRLQPHSREAEEAVLGAILINSEKFYDVAQIISANDFYIHRCRWIWEAFAALLEKGQDIDVQTVANELEKNGKLTEAGGKLYLYSLASNTPSSMHAESYAKIIAEKSVRRQVLTAASQMQQYAYDESKSLDTILDNSEKAIFNVSEKRTRNEVQPIRSVVGTIYDEVRLLARQDQDIVGVPTGFKDLDRLLGGMQKSDLIIVAGRPGMGKTGFLLSVLKNAALNYHMHVAMFSLEMSNEQLAIRLIAQQTGINSQKIRSGKLAEDELPMFIDALDVLGTTTVFLDDTPAITPLQLRSKCRRLDLEHHLDLVIVDYLQLMSTDSRNENRVQEVSYISRNLKILARELNVPVLTAAQLSRSVEQRSEKIPILSDLRESGSLEQDADVVMFLHNPNTDDSKTIGLDGAMKLVVAKHRNGPVGDIDLVFVKKLARFENAARISDSGGIR